MTAYPVGLSRDLGIGRVMRGDAGGADVAIWRDREGDLHAWHNRCPHRGMRLSHGFVRGDRLACLYHGWQFGKDGGCAYIPAHPDLEPPQTIHAQVNTVWEESDVVWVALDGDAQPSLDGSLSAPLRSLNFATDKTRTDWAMTSTGIGENMPKAVADGFHDIGGALVRWVSNPIDAKSTTVHVLCAHETDVAQRKVLSRWLEAARRRAEQSDEVMA